MRRPLGLLFLVASALPACHHKPVSDLGPSADAAGWLGPDTVTVDLLRAGDEEGARSRIFVQARLPDGELGVFMVDTGAAISALSEDTAERLKLPVERNWGSVEGLGGRTDYHRAVMPQLVVGDAIVPDVEFAVGVRGVPKYAGFMPLDGILGNNVWSRFVAEIDYPADLLVLHRPGTRKMPRWSAPMRFDGGHVFTPIGLVTASDPAQSGTTLIQIDTGASGLLVSGANAMPFDVGSQPGLYSEGIEPVYGIGAAETMPANVFFRRTRHVPLSKIDFGGRKQSIEQLYAQWLNFDASPAIGPADMPGLAGHELMHHWNAVFDFQGQRFALEKSRRKPRKVNGHRVLLEQDVARYGDDPARALYRAKLHAGLDELDRTEALLEQFLGASPSPKDAAEARMLLATVRRYEGDLEGAWAAIETMRPDELVEQGEIIASVNGFLLDGRAEEALALADRAIRDYQARKPEEKPAPPPDPKATFLPASDRAPAPGAAPPEPEWEATAEADAHVARADALLALRRFDEANTELLVAANLVENPDAHLLRRARVALARGDRHGAMAHIRRLLQLYPSNGQWLWFYATLIDGVGTPQEKETFRADMQDAIARLHGDHRPLDYMVVAHHILGDQERAVALMNEGIERDCGREELDAASRDNCVAWYKAMGGVDPDDALRRIEAALAAEGDRSDFLDTRAMVHLARGEWAAARDYSVKAARMSPDDVYMLWQAERIADIARRMTESQAAK